VIALCAAHADVTALCVSPNRKYFAVAVSGCVLGPLAHAHTVLTGVGRERAVISVFETRTLKKRKVRQSPPLQSLRGSKRKRRPFAQVLSTVETISNQFTSLCFSPDGASLLAQSGTHQRRLHSPKRLRRLPSALPAARVWLTKHTPPHRLARLRAHQLVVG
jgi:hypothetical protein